MGQVLRGCHEHEGRLAGACGIGIPTPGCHISKGSRRQPRGAILPNVCFFMRFLMRALFLETSWSTGLYIRRSTTGRAGVTSPGIPCAAMLHTPAALPGRSAGLALQRSRTSSREPAFLHSRPRSARTASPQSIRRRSTALSSIGALHCSNRPRASG
jgi:hypothetical protein